MKYEHKKKDKENYENRFAWLPMFFIDCESENFVFIWLENYWRKEIDDQWGGGIYRTIYNPAFYD